ncbi:hypothetical protein AM501_08155 [Aneurinibacillus migulanus]|uniref:hypothetical protein n=1 Tax=Aneurinibacillus migulanus TaxID=47500 RepID=UPI0005BA0E03|nr:hypothetical protein [Aneurinibacillus migulanus]KIV55891.1 hypothetical protein TS64_10240 [Aneurinibacillus migulanus]KPD08775.1 hypothetical protein AM501_08155 [Aneurinibacillus migulanus]MCP1357388.1 hypothetical protein [Aneurinibacillus migulanus]
MRPVNKKESELKNTRRMCQVLNFNKELVQKLALVLVLMRVLIVQQVELLLVAVLAPCLFGQELRHSRHLGC